MGAETHEAVIVGGGISGAAVAYYLAAVGMRDVVLLERSTLGAGTTGKSVAMVTTHDPSEPERVLAAEGLRLFESFEREEAQVRFLRQVGVVHLVPARFRRLMEQTVRAQRELGLDVEVVHAAELAQLLPGASIDEDQVGVLEAGAGYADPIVATRAYAEAAERRGVTVRVGCEVSQIVTDGARVCGVETTIGRLSAPVVVIAAGVASTALLNRLGIDLGLTPRRVQVARFSLPAEEELGRVVIDSTQGMWMRPADGAVLVGAELGLQVTGTADADGDVEPWYAELCREKLARRFPRLATSGASGGWTGAITMSRDGRPIIDAVAEFDGLYCIVGDSGSSFKTAAATGEEMARWIVDGTRDGVLDAFRRGDRPAFDGHRGYGSLGLSLRLAREQKAAQEKVGSGEASARSAP